MANSILLLSAILLLAAIQLFDHPMVSNAQYVDGFTSGSILNNLWGRKKRSPASIFPMNEQFVDGGDDALPASVIRAKRQFYADGFTRGTIWNNFWGRKRRSADAAADEVEQHPTMVENEQQQQQQQPAMVMRAKRQFYADPLTSGTILMNGWGRKRRFADGWTSGTILRNLY